MLLHEAVGDRMCFPLTGKTGHITIGLKTPIAVKNIALWHPPLADSVASVFVHEVDVDGYANPATRFRHLARGVSAEVGT